MWTNGSAFAGLMIVNAPTRPKSEIARLGKEIYQRDIRSKVEADHIGEGVAIDVDNGKYALDQDANAASESLREQQPDAQVWLMRVEYPSLRAFGGSSLRRAG